MKFKKGDLVKIADDEYKYSYFAGRTGAVDEYRSYAGAYYVLADGGFVLVAESDLTLVVLTESKYVPDLDKWMKKHGRRKAGVV